MKKILVLIFLIAINKAFALEKDLLVDATQDLNYAKTM